MSSTEIYFMLALSTLVLMVIVIFGLKQSDHEKRINAMSIHIYDTNKRINRVVDGLNAKNSKLKGRAGDPAMRPGAIIQLDENGMVLERKRQKFYVNTLKNGGARIFIDEDKARASARVVKGGCDKVAVPVEV